MIDDEFCLENEMKIRNVPSYYQISWDKKTASFMIKVRAELMLAFYEFFTPDNYLVKYYQNNEALIVDKFLPPKKRKFWGFGRVFRLVNQDDKYVTYRARLRRRRKNEDGSLNYDNLMATNLSVSLNVLAVFLNCSQEIIADKAPFESQLIAFNLKSEVERYYGFSIWATVSKVVADWLRKFKDKTYFDEISEVMLQAWQSLSWSIRFGKKDCRDYFMAIHQSGPWINLGVPGSSCGLDPKDYWDQNAGYPLSPHNTDIPCQQLALLAGLAALCDLYGQAHPLS